MNFELNRLSTSYELRCLGEDDVARIYALCRENTLFYEHCPPFVSAESIRGDMAALPPGKTAEDKYYAGYFDGGKLVAVLDLIIAFPDSETAFVGFFMVDKALQHREVGSAIIEQLCAGLRAQGFSHIRLGWVSGNAQSEHFWHKLGFKETGVRSDTGAYTIIYAQREI